MGTLVVDIETVGLEWSEISEKSRKSLTKWINQGVEEKGREYLLEQIKSQLGLSPFTGKVVSLAVYDIEREIGAVYFVSDVEGESSYSNSFNFKVRTEQEIIEDFWDGARNYDTFVTFNGRAFALPFLLHRSVVHRIKPSVEITRQRYLTKQSLPYHVDLLDEITFYGSIQKRPSLQLVCDAYGICYDSKIGGEDIAEFFRQKKFRDIANHNAQDVLAIKKLYEIWNQHLAPLSFLNTL
jgi:DNA polymerase elongation subunit (family B)